MKQARLAAEDPLIRVRAGHAQPTCAADVRAPAPGVCAPRPAPGPERTSRVLVVDDDPAMCLLASEALEAAGMEVLVAEDGAEALEIYRGTRPDLVLLDVMMPVMDGFDACAGIRRLPGGEETPVVMMTGSDDVDSINRAYDVGATDFITKPVNYLVLTQRVRYMLRAKRTADDLRESASLLESSQRVAKVGHWAWDLTARSVRCSKQLETILGMAPPAQVDGPEDLSCLAHPRDRSQVEQAIAAVVRDGDGASLEHLLRRGDGSQRIVLHEIQPHRDGQGRVTRVLGTVQDITERRESEQQVRYLAYYDSVTGLPNRTLFMDQLNHALLTAHRHCRYAAVLFLDLDHFKRINDTLGHSAGDTLLREVATRLRDCIRDSDIVCHDDTIHRDPLDRHCVARLGGDEFVIMLSDLRDPTDAGSVAQRICEAISAPFDVDGNDVYSGCSVGVSCYPNDGDNVETLLKHADAAMYHAKSEGRNQYQFYTKAINARVLERVALENSMRKALDEEGFEVHYQPKIDIGTGEVTSVEALLRWYHPELGEVPPSTFIAVAEDTGLIVPLGEWVLNQACRQTARWRASGHEQLQVAVNLSPAQFRSPALRQAVEDALASSGLPASCLELELTESVLMEDVRGSAGILEELTSLGIKVTVDDFGVGYSSLTQLKRFPVSSLKIDRSFVRDMIASSDDAAIVAATIALGHSLRLNVVAEGVEDEEQLEFLRRHQCDESQGFLFSSPVNAEELLSWLDRRKRGDAPEPETVTKS